MGTSTIVKSQSISVTATTTLVPGITQPTGLASIDVLSRYPRLAILLDTFAPNARLLDRLISPLWLPFALVGCILCIVVYGNPQWRRSFRSRSGILINAFGSASLSVFMIFLSAAHLTSSFLVIIIDLDNAWDTGLLALSQSGCPLIHSLSTWARCSTLLLTLAVGLEALSILCQLNHISYHKYFRHITANGQPRRAVKVCLCILTVTFIYGLVETAYWRVQYYYLENGGESQADHFAAIPVARCEIAGGLQYWFSAKPMNKFDRLLGTDREDRITALAASYSDYQWISGIIIECLFSLANISMALVVIKMALIRDNMLLGSQAFGQRGQTRSKMNDLEVNHLIALGLVQGLLRLPMALLNMLDPLTRPGELALTDTELSYDPTWQRFFTMSTIRSVAFELSELPAALLLPICILFSKQFRSDLYLLFCQIKQTTRPKLKPHPLASQSQSNKLGREAYEKSHQSEPFTARSFTPNPRTEVDMDTDDKTYETTRSPCISSRIIQPLIPDSPNSSDIGIPVQSHRVSHRHLPGCPQDRSTEDGNVARVGTNVTALRNPLYQSNIYLPRYEPKSHWKQYQRSVSASNLMFSQQQSYGTQLNAGEENNPEHRSYV